jgi:hypothetical protein
LVFISCGQSSHSERQLGKEIAKLVEEVAGCTAHFAENQSSLDGVTENILKRLNDAVAFIAIMHPHGSVSNPSERDNSWTRGSVWVEQEIAIAAFISQALDRPMKVRCYVHKDIRREGLRDKLHLNPKEFVEDSEILDDLATFLQGWRALGQEKRKDQLSLRARIDHRRVPIPGGGGDDQRYELRVSIENDGEQDATDFKLTVDFPSGLVDEGAHVLRTRSATPGFERFQVTNVERDMEHLYPGERTPDLITFHYAIKCSGNRERAEQLRQIVIATVYSRWALAAWRKGVLWCPFRNRKEFQMRSKKGPTDTALPGTDIEQMAFVVMMDAAKSAGQDLKMIMAEVKAITAAKNALRSLISKVGRDVANNAAQKDGVPPLDLSAGMGSENAYYDAPMPLPDPESDSGVIFVPTKLYNGQIITVAQLRCIQENLKSQLDSMNEMSEMTSMRLQMAMDRRSKLIETLSNIMKKISATGDTLVRNLK